MREQRSSTSRLILVATITSALVVLAAQTPAAAQSTGTKLGSAQSQYTRIKAAYERIGEEYARLEAKRGSTAIQMSATQASIVKTRSDITSLKKKIRTRLRAAYMMRGVGVFDFLLQARSFHEFSLRYMVLQQQSLADQQTILEMRRKTAELKSQQKSLAAQGQALAGQTADLVDQGRRLTVSLNQANRLVRQLQGQLKLEQLQKLFHITNATARGNGTIIPMDDCPIAGPHYVTNSFGDPRGGGTRRHQGNDIMSPKGTPVVAVVDGTVYQKTGGLGGLAYHLQGTGALFYYAHLNDFVAPDGSHVKAGQLIGHNGNTGDAAGGPNHVHFEIHPGYGWTQAIDPYPSLSQVC